MDYEIVVGLEVHAELATKTKIFCSCTTEFGGEPNTHCCPGCLGMPGTLPVLNGQVVEYAVKAGLALNCSISKVSGLDRKNYYYPDLPKAYQISQLYTPLCQNGWVEIGEGSNLKKIRIKEIHIEEDAGKLIHDEWSSETLIDYNRGGVPLIEIVSEPDFRSASEVTEYLEKLKAILKYTGVSDCKMEEGSLRADVNLSVKPTGSEKLGVRTEMKNLNSFKAISRAVEAEAARHLNEIRNGGEIIQETRRWDDAKGESYSMRSKEDAQDYRYFPDPDLVPIVIDDEFIRQIKDKLPELPDERKKRYINDMGLPEYDASIITGSLMLAELLDETVGYGAPAKTVSNWIMGDILRMINETGDESYKLKFGGKSLAELIGLVNDGKISNTAAKKVFKILFETGRLPSEIVKSEGLEMMDDVDFLLGIIRKIIEANPKSVSDYKSGKLKASGFLLGQIMREVRGKADPQTVGKMLEGELNKI